MNELKTKSYVTLHHVKKQHFECCSTSHSHCRILNKEQVMML